MKERFKAGLESGVKAGLKFRYMVKPSYKAALAAVTAAMLCVSVLSGCGTGDAAAENTAGSDTSVQGTSADSQERINQLEADADNGLFILINKENHVDGDYCPDDLAPIKYYAEDREAKWRFMRSEAADHFHEMVEAAGAEGIDFVMTTAYRAYGMQSALWENALSRYGSEEAANAVVAKPGESEHQSGLGVDVSSAENNYQLTEAFGETEAGRWIVENGAEYGFIIRYPADKVDITGYDNEPWHLRYVGKTAAREITAQGLALEEYVEQLKSEGILD